jgi:uncharacterized protein YbcI
VRRATHHRSRTVIPVTERALRQQPLTGGELNAAIARSAVRVQSRFVGRGPTKAQAFFRHNFVVVVMQDAMTTSEHSLAAAGKREAALQLRKQLQQTMRAQLVAEVERLTGCRVLAFMSDSHLDPDLAAELFVLDRSIPEEGRSVDPAAPG